LISRAARASNDVQEQRRTLAGTQRAVSTQPFNIHQVNAVQKLTVPTVAIPIKKRSTLSITILAGSPHFG
jgi:hypothetical protein